MEDNKVMQIYIKYVLMGKTGQKLIPLNSSELVCLQTLNSISDTFLLDVNNTYHVLL